MQLFTDEMTKLFATASSSTERILELKTEQKTSIKTQQSRILQGDLRIGSIMSENIQQQVALPLVWILRDMIVCPLNLGGKGESNTSLQDSDFNEACISDASTSGAKVFLKISN